MKNIENLLHLNLQFFAEGEGGETDAEAAAPQEEEAGETDVQKAETVEPQSPETNAVYANIRRKAEADAQQKFDAQMQAINRQFADMYQGHRNPETGQPIQSAQDFLVAMQAQKRAEVNEQLAEAGVDPSYIDKAVAASPLMQQAQAALQENMSIRAGQQLQADLEAIRQIDPSIQNETDLFSSDGIMQAIQMVKNSGMTLADAYKLVNFDRLRSLNTEAAQQQAINSARGKNHLTTAAGVSTGEELSDIPSGEIGRWRQMFPEKNDKELKALYNKQQRMKGA